jgi:hypothetical protein
VTAPPLREGGRRSGRGGSEDSDSWNGEEASTGIGVGGVASGEGEEEEARRAGAGGREERRTLTPTKRARNRAIGAALEGRGAGGDEGAESLVGREPYEAIGRWCENRSWR